MFAAIYISGGLSLYNIPKCSSRILLLCRVICRHSRAVCCKFCLLAEHIVQKIRKRVFVLHKNERG